MKYFIVFLLALILGYFLYPKFNPPVETVIYRTEKQSTVIPIETRGHVVENVPATPDKPLNVQVDVQPEKTVEVPVEVEVKDVKKALRKKMTVADKIMANKIDMKTYMGFVQFTSVTGQDSRVLKLNGTFKGKLKNVIPSRTGILENITFAVNQDPEKEMTKFVVRDVYDNTHLNIYQLTDSSFKSVPGDENLLMLRSPQGFILLDMKSYPSINGKIFNMNKMTGHFVLTKAKTKANQLD